MFRRVGFFFFLLVFWACTRVSDDRVEPEFSSLEINDSIFVPGEVLEIEVSGTDNEELGQLRARIREAFAKSFEFWELVEVRDLSGTTFTESFSYTVPDSALAGLYEVSVQISDERGNGSVDSTFQIFVRQEGEEPIITGFQTDPPLGGDDVLTIGETDTLTFAGMVSDMDTVASFSISFIDEFGIKLQTLTYVFSDTTAFDLSSAPDTAFFADFEFFPVEMELKATDFPGHQRRLNYAVEIE